MAQHDAETEAAIAAMATWIDTEIGSCLSGVIAAYPNGEKAAASDMIDWQCGKLFELYAFLELLDELHVIGWSASAQNLNGGDYVYNGSPTLAKSSMSHVIIQQGPRQLAVWQSVEFTGLSYSGSAVPSTGEYHEADILIIDKMMPPSASSFRPSAEEIALVVECKFMPKLSKTILRGVLGLRREMSYLSDATPTILSGGTAFPSHLPASAGKWRKRASHLWLAYAFAPLTDSISTRWSSPASKFGIRLWQLK